METELDSAIALQRIGRDTTDERAWEYLICNHEDDIRGIALRITGNPDLAEEVLQETWLRIQAGSGAFRPRESATISARNWILRIAHNVALDILRKHKSNETRKLKEEVPSSFAESGNELSRDRLESVYAALAELPKTLRTVITLKYFSGLDFRGIAASLGCSEVAAKKRFQRGMQWLRRRLVLIGLILSPAKLQEILSRGSVHAAESSAPHGDVPQPMPCPEECSFPARIVSLFPVKIAVASMVVSVAVFTFVCAPQPRVLISTGPVEKANSANMTIALPQPRKASVGMRANNCSSCHNSMLDQTITKCAWTAEPFLEF